jgi:hypothetical protein
MALVTFQRTAPSNRAVVGIDQVVQSNMAHFLAAAVFYLLDSNPSDCITSRMWMIHFLRRLWETNWVFNFSHKPVPYGDATSEHIYYASFAALIVRDLNRNPPAATVLGLPLGCTHPLVLLWFVAEGCNNHCHSKLAALPKGKDRRRPSGLYFQHVSCPHYFFEMCSWFLFAAVAGFTTYTVYYFVVSALVMACHAVKRHRQYETMRDGRQGTCTPMFPFGIDIRPPEILVQIVTVSTNDVVVVDDEAQNSVVGKDRCQGQVAPNSKGNSKGNAKKVTNLLRKAKA